MCLNEELLFVKKVYYLLQISSSNSFWKLKQMENWE